MVFMILTAIVAVLVAVLALQNSMMVDLTLFMWSFRLNLVLVVLISVICGFLLAADTTTTPVAAPDPTPTTTVRKF